MILSHVRNRLTVESTRALLCLGAWSKAGFVRKEDIHEVASMPDLKLGEGQDELDEFDMVL